MSDLAALLTVLDVDVSDRGTFTAHSIDEGRGVVFGGQLLAQTVVAGARALPGKEVRSLHQVFARGASPAAPLDGTVEVMHQGRAFASATVSVGQGGKLCTRGVLLAHAPDPDLIRHATPMPDAGDPDGLEPRIPGGWWDVRIAGNLDFADPALVAPPELCVWTRFPGAPGDALTSQALLAYASDGFLIGTAMLPHPGVGQALAHQTVSTTVLTHTLSFHEPFDAAEWLLLAHRSSYAGRGRAYGSADVFTRDGRLVASYVQESMVRAFPEGQAPPEGQRSAH